MRQYQLPKEVAGLLWIALLWLALPSLAQATWQSTRLPEGNIAELVRQEAPKFGVPVPLALAVAKVESNFNPRAQSSAGARGVMQIMPATARDEYGISAERLWQPRINVRLGLHFLKRLLIRYSGRTDLALSYYNGGSRVGDLPHARVIPATRRYVHQVQRLQRSYARQEAR